MFKSFIIFLKCFSKIKLSKNLASLKNYQMKRLKNLM